MSDQDQAAADDFSSLGGFFFYAFIVHPCTAWILRPGRFERKKSIMYAIAFLAALAAIKTGEYQNNSRIFCHILINCWHQVSTMIYLWVLMNVFVDVDLCHVDEQTGMQIASFRPCRCTAVPRGSSSVQIVPEWSVHDQSMG